MLLKCIRRMIIKRLIREALEELPELKAQGINLIKAHKDEFLEHVKNQIKIAVQNFIAKKVNQAKEKIVKITENKN